MSKALQKTIKWYDDHAADYAAKIKKKTQLEELKKFCKLLPPNSLVLDAGCAAGRDSGILKEQGFKVTGVDLSRGLLEIAEKENPNIDFINANFLDLPFANNSFSGIWASAALVHFQTQNQVKKALLEFKRVLKNQGVIYLSMQNRAGEQEGWVKDTHSRAGRFFQFYDLEKISQLVEQCGFKIIESFTRKSSRPGIVWSVVYAKKV